MRYPNSNKTYHKTVSYANRGMNLEELINDTNKYYLENNIAIVYKKPTPIGIVSVEEKNNTKIITRAFFKEPSTLDYIGLYNGNYIEFDAKQTLNKTSFPLSNLSSHQINHIRKIIDNHGITFLIINMNKNYYLFSGKNLINFIDTQSRKSIPFHIIKNEGLLIKNNNLIIDYITEVKKLIGGTNEKN